MSMNLKKGFVVAVIALTAACGDSSSSNNNRNQPPPAPSYTGTLSVTSTDYGTDVWSIELGSPDFALSDANKYVLAITLASDTDGQPVKLKLTNSVKEVGYPEYVTLACTATKTLETCTSEPLPTSALPGTTSTARLVIDLGKSQANSFFYFKDAKVIEQNASGTVITPNLLDADTSAMTKSGWGSWNNAGAAPVLAVVE